MEKFGLARRSKIVQFYQHSIIFSQRAYRNVFDVQNVPTPQTIYRLLQRFQHQGILQDLPHSGRSRSIRTA